MSNMYYLPTLEEFKAAISRDNTIPEWSEPKFKCPECNEGGMRKNNMVVLTTYPAKYEYRCDKCGHIEYLHG